MDVFKVRDSFSILKRKIGNYPLVYFDNAATTQKPQNEFIMHNLQWTFSELAGRLDFHWQFTTLRKNWI